MANFKSRGTIAINTTSSEVLIKSIASLEHLFPNVELRMIMTNSTHDAIRKYNAKKLTLTFEAESEHSLGKEIKNFKEDIRELKKKKELKEKLTLKEMKNTEILFIFSEVENEGKIKDYKARVKISSRPSSKILEEKEEELNYYTASARDMNHLLKIKDPTVVRSSKKIFTVIS